MRLCVLGLVLLLMVPSGVASGARAVDGQIVLHSAPTLEGTATFGGADAVIDLAPAVGAGEAISISWTSASGWQIYSDWTLVNAPVDRVEYAEPARNETRGFDAGTLQGLQCGLRCRVLLLGLGDEGTDVGVVGEALGKLHAMPQPKTFWAQRENASAQNAFYHEIPRGSYAASAHVAPQVNALAGAVPHATGRLGLLLFNATGVVHTGAERIQVDTIARTQPLVGSGGVVVAEAMTVSHLFLVLEGAELSAAPGSFAVLYAPAPSSLRLDGVLSVSAASGDVSFGGDESQLRRQPLRIDGDLSLVLGQTEAADLRIRQTHVLPAGEVRAGLSGEARSVRISGVEVVETESRAVMASGLTLAAVAASVLLFLNRAPLLAALYSRISRSRILSNPRRQQIYDLVAQQPGVTATELAQATGLARVVVQHHLRMLETHQMVTVRPNGRRRAYYLMGEVPAGELLQGQAALRDESRRRIAEAVLAANEPLTQNALAAGTGLSQRLVSYHLSHLQERGLVSAEGSQPRRYRPTDLLASLLRAEQGDGATQGGGAA